MFKDINFLMMVHADQSFAKSNLILEKNVNYAIQDIKINQSQILKDLFVGRTIVRKSLTMVGHVSNARKDID